MSRIYLYGLHVLKPPFHCAAPGTEDLHDRWPHLKAPAAVHGMPFWNTSEKTVIPLGDSAGEQKTFSPSDFSVEVAQQAKASFPGADSVGAVFHAQCTLSPNALSSSCLRLVNDVFPHASETVAITQCGSAGGAVALDLALRRLRDTSHPLPGYAYVSTSDVWLPPFSSPLPGFSAFDDGAAGVFLAKEHAHSTPVAEVLGFEQLFSPTCRGRGLAFGEGTMAIILKNAISACQTLLARFEGIIVDSVHGDPLPDEMKSDFMGALAAHSHGETQVGWQSTHRTTSTFYYALHDALHSEKGHRGNGIALIWTSSPTGHAAALLVRVMAKIDGHHITELLKI